MASLRLQAVAAVLALVAAAGASHGFEFHEATVEAIHLGFTNGTLTSKADIIAFNNAHPVLERLKDFGQDNLIEAEKTQGIGSAERAAIQRLEELSINGLEKLMQEHQLDAIVTPDSVISSLLAIGGYPGIVVPAGYDKQGVPFAVCFGGLQGYEPRLIEVDYAFEQATKVTRPPTFKTQAGTNFF